MSLAVVGCVMRRIKASAGDIFRPRGQARRELDLAGSDPGEVIDILGSRLSEARKMRIDNVVAHRTGRLALAVEGVHDPHNTAAVIRTADAYGVQNVHIIEGAGRFQSSRKVTQGAHKWVDLVVWGNAEGFVNEMRGQGTRVLVATMDGAQDIGSISVKKPAVLVFGNEAEGISEKMYSMADGTFRVPMYGFVESFNVSVAAAIITAALRAHGAGDLTPREAEILRARFYLRAVKAGYDIVTLERGRRKD